MLNSMYATAVIIVILVIAIVVLGGALVVVEMQQPTASYTFIQGLDTNGGDINCNGALLNNVPALEAACNADDTCLGFNTNGCIKNTLDNWYNWSAATSTEGFYLKVSPNKT